MRNKYAILPQANKNHCCLFGKTPLPELSSQTDTTNVPGSLESHWPYGYGPQDVS